MQVSWDPDTKPTMEVGNSSYYTAATLFQYDPIDKIFI